MGPRTHDTNEELRDAIRKAREVGGALVVTDVSRLGRHDYLADLLDTSGVPVVSLDTGRILSTVELRRRLKAAKKAGETNRERTRKALARAKAAGKRLGNPNWSPALRRAHIKRIVKKDERAEQIAEYLAKHDPDNVMSAAEIAALLNSVGMRTGQGNMWSRSRVLNFRRRCRG
jgi:DNA invertase Pin-like site-specific DNA recombinase